jgi:uncharacterized protein YqhQ
VPGKTAYNSPTMFTAANPPIRVGGMAFGNGVLMRGPHYWAWATEGREVAYAPVRSLLYRRRLGRIPLLRSLISFAEMVVLMFSLHRKNGLRRGVRFAVFIIAALALDMGLSIVVPFVVHNVFLANIVLAILAFGVGIFAMRLGLGKAIWRYHGAEHKAVNAYEGGADLQDMEQVNRFSRVHDRCGTNLAVIALFITVVSYFVLQSLPLIFGGVYALLVIAVSLEFFRLIGSRPGARTTRAVLAGGRALQRSVTTSEPGVEHLELACAALRCVVELEVGLRRPVAPGIAAS